MRIPLFHQWLQKPTKPSPEGQRKKKKRLGVTAMEYLVMASLVIAVLILTIQHLGAITGGLLGSSANATNKTVTTGS